jgi:ABC-type uncharacterized transport system substrate-binding protein
VILWIMLDDKPANLEVRLVEPDSDETTRNEETTTDESDDSPENPTATTSTRTRLAARCQADADPKVYRL